MRKFAKILIFLMLPIICVRPLFSIDLNKILGFGIGKDRAVALILSDVEHRKKQIIDLKKEREVLKQRAKDTVKKLKSSLKNLQPQVDRINEKREDASGSYEESLKKQLVIIDDRKQNFKNFQDLWKEVDGKIVKHIKLIEEIVELLTAGPGPQRCKVVCSWKDFDETRGQINQLMGKIDTHNAQRDRLKKLIEAEKEEIASWKRDVELKNAERENIAKERVAARETDEAVASIAEWKEKARVIEQQTFYLEERIEVAEFKKKDFEREERYKYDELFLLNQKLKRLRDELVLIQEKLVIDVSDVEQAKGELEKAEKAVSKKLDIVRSERNGFKNRRARLNNTIKSLEEQLEKIKKSGEMTSVNGYLIDSRLMVYSNEKRIIDHELEVLKTKKERLEIDVKIKAVKAQIIEVLHVLRGDRKKIDDWLLEFRTKMRAVEHSKKVLKGRGDEIINLISMINKELEESQSKAQEIEKQRDKLFVRSIKEYLEILSNIKEKVVSALNLQKRIVERHFSQISEFSARQEVLIDQYKFIIKHLESQKLESLWKRSKRAISLEQIGASLVEAEKLFADLFWMTPSYLGPVAIFYTLKSFTIVDYLGLFLFVLLFLFLFIALKFFLLFVRNNIKSWFRPRVGVESFVEFLLQHFTLIFSWLFFFFHIRIGATYFRPLAATYSVTIFYLATIPILIYISNRFVARLRLLNRQLNFLFISETLERKTTMLIEICFYTTSVLLPLRSAFLAHFQSAIAFSEVALAAYTLILIIIILFFLNKEDWLRLLSGKNFFVVWLRKKVDRYYYPVFLFFMFLLILSNPYIGYSNLAWYLVFAVPVTIFSILGLFLLHAIIRRLSLFLFIKEEDDEVINKFEHAKAYYGLFVVVTFIIFVLAALVLLARLWGIEGYTIGSLWKSLSETWVIRIGARPEEKLGFIEFGKLGLFITGGLVISSFIKRFILGRLFEIFRTEPGVQNTVSKILHYFIIMFALILGFTVINLSQYALAVGGLLLVGLSFGLRDQIADYFAGILVLIERPLEIGHYVESGEHRGKVHRISARSTTLKTARNFFITIPNSDLISKPIINWGQGRYAVGCELNIMVSFNSDPELVQKVMLEVMKEHSMVLRVPAPLVRFEGFEASALYFYCRCYVSARKVSDMWDLASDLRFSVVKRFKENNIVIPFPQTVVHFADKQKKKNQQGPTEGSPEGGVQKNPINIRFDDKG
jgi:small-conductance mechanosensitive channel